MLTARTATDSELHQALELQFKRYSKAERDQRTESLTEALVRGDARIDCLVVANERQVLGVQLLICQRDGTLYVWPVELEKHFATTLAAPTVKADLYQLALDRFNSTNSWIAQSLLEESRRKQSDEMTRHGIPYLTDLLFLGRLCEGSLPLPSRSRKLQSVTYDECANRARFARVLEETYVETLDCPELSFGTRTGESAIDSHMLSGSFEPTRWRVYVEDDRDVGLVLMTQHAPDPVWEVVYIGVVPSARGRGLGKALLAESLRLATVGGATELILGVDARNAPAISMYERLGFEQFERRIVHAKIRTA